MKSKYNFVIFDVDGTIYDSFVSITKTFQYTLREMCGLDIQDPEIFRPYIGPPLVDSLSRYGLAGDELVRAVEMYRVYYMQTLGHSVLFDGMRDLLDSLKAAGVRTAVASSKATWVVMNIFERDGIAHYFEYVAGMENENNKETKAQAIERSLKRCAVTDRSTAVMVGDRIYDAVGARDTGLDFIAAGYGPGSRAEFDGLPMILYADTVADIKQFLL